MSTPHKWADVIKAMADGIEVEFYSELGLYWVPSGSGVTPLSHPDLKWRVKPEPKTEVTKKPDIDLFANVYKDYTTCLGKESIKDCDLDQTDDRVGIIHYVVDGETGLLKSAEVVK